MVDAESAEDLSTVTHGSFYMRDNAWSLLEESGNEREGQVAREAARRKSVEAQMIAEADAATARRRACFEDYLEGKLLAEARRCAPEDSEAARLHAAAAAEAAAARKDQALVARMEAISRPIEVKYGPHQPTDDVAGSSGADDDERLTETTVAATNVARHPHVVKKKNKKGKKGAASNGSKVMWNAAEDRALRSGIEKHGPKWALILAEGGGVWQLMHGKGTSLRERARNLGILPDKSL